MRKLSPEVAMMISEEYFQVAAIGRLEMPPSLPISPAKTPYSLSPAPDKLAMFTSEFDYLRAFGEDSLDLPQGSHNSFEISPPTHAYQAAELMLDQAYFKSHESDPLADAVFDSYSPSGVDVLSESFGLFHSQFPVSVASPTSSGEGLAASGFLLDPSFQLAPISPQGEDPSGFVNAPSSPFGLSLGCSESVAESDSDVVSINDVKDTKALPGPADRSYFKVDLEFPWPVYIKDPDRLRKVMQWKKKKITVLQENKVKKNTYQVRTDVANRRMRVKGRFVGKCIS